MRTRVPGILLFGLLAAHGLRAQPPTDADCAWPAVRPAPAEVRASLDQIEHGYGVRVVFALEDEQRKSLEAWYRRKGIRISMLDEDDHARALAALWRALGQYPCDLPRRYVDGVILVERARLKTRHHSREFQLKDRDPTADYLTPPDYRDQPLNLDVAQPRNYRGLTHGRVLLLALDHIEPTFHHELLHRIELAEAERVPLFAAWDRNRELDGSWRDDGFSPHARDSGPEDRASCAEALFSRRPGELRELLQAGDTRAQKLLQLQELYVMVSDGRMSHSWWSQRLAGSE